MAEELFGATADELREIDVNNEESDDEDDDDETDFNLVTKKVLNHSIDELIEAESLLKTSDDPKINWETNSAILLKPLKRKKQNQMKKRRMLPMIIQRTI